MAYTHNDNDNKQNPYPISIVCQDCRIPLHHLIKVNGFN